ncbi:CDP-archaeol synthase [Nitrosococcus wardiae]|uniref:CDP-archaeol synthase n=1 Tax=Nitrosococcus wardiae TaxID=1814290 RepID=A0A4P7C1P7_9GAMM|nr:CDP-archaeol synthase [Nitrosococcus wardiae]QBQ54812.1 CDP-archaeol synthase [Nitrosococcus wardiae]
MDLISLLLLLLVANGTPVITAFLLKDRFNWPLDGRLRLPDGNPLFGSSKTIRGIAAAILTTALIALLFGFSLITGALFGFWAMVGDLVSSFIKRRFGLPAGANVPGLDHIPEAFFPLCFLRSQMTIPWLDLAVILLAFALLDLFLWYLWGRLYPRFHSR